MRIPGKCRLAGPKKASAPAAADSSAASAPPPEPEYFDPAKVPVAKDLPDSHNPDSVAVINSDLPIKEWMQKSKLMDLASVCVTYDDDEYLNTFPITDNENIVKTLLLTVMKDNLAVSNVWTDSQNILDICNKLFGCLITTTWLRLQRHPLFVDHCEDKSITRSLYLVGLDTGLWHVHNAEPVEQSVFQPVTAEWMITLYGQAPMVLAPSLVAGDDLDNALVKRRVLKPNFDLKAMGIWAN